MPSPARSRLDATLIGVALLLAGGGAGVVGWARQASLADEVASLRAGVAATPRRTIELEEELAGLREELGTLHGVLQTALDDGGVVEAIAGRLESTERDLDQLDASLATLDRSIHDQASVVAALEQAASGFDPATLEATFDHQSRALEERYESLRERVEAATRLADESRERLRMLDDALATSRDRSSMWRELLGPTVQLAGATSVGSGVLLPSRPVVGADGEADGHETFVLTAWHVVRDIVDGDLDSGVPVTIYHPDGSRTEEVGRLLAHDVPLDAALLLLERTEPVEFAAHLPTRERLGAVRVFDRVYAVGCPLGNDPIPTPGEIATRRHQVEGSTYWMVNAPTYIGNSGGGIFDAETHELLAIFSKIYTHGALRPTIVPHMGLATPLGDVYAWMEESGYGFLVPTESAEPARPRHQLAVAGAQPR